MRLDYSDPQAARAQRHGQACTGKPSSDNDQVEIHESRLFGKNVILPQGTRQVTQRRLAQ
ncbi:hypothetical protein [Aromatoleum aromaticum]|uniref:hypothetical protein n=1 Tax=Aromatoleum aromaticum TaxID=551760 RepID=UPI002006DF4D|nr:hypothetical protein [Aromatoleum aromaticum]